MAQYHTATGNHAGGESIQFNGLVQASNLVLPGGTQLPQKSDCMSDLARFDPTQDMTKIEMSKGTPLKECYDWLFSEDEYKSWKDSDQSGVLWIKGGPGKGKTMMALALARELSEEFPPRSKMDRISHAWCLLTAKSRTLVTYFFCQNDIPDRNSATSIVNGLVCLLAKLSKRLRQVVQSKYDEVGAGIEDLSWRIGILRSIFEDSGLEEVYIIVDALDVCTIDRSEFLKVIGNRRIEGETCKVKWLVTSRDTHDIRNHMGICSASVIDLDSDLAADAVMNFIKFKMKNLDDAKRYSPKLKKKIEAILQKKAEGTFLWVALACHHLEVSDVLPADIPKELKNLRSGLEPMYDEMMKHLELAPPSTHTAQQSRSYCQEILRSATLTYRPLHYEQLESVADLPDRYLTDKHSLKELVRRCGGFLVEKKDVILFIHQSAKDYFVSGNGKRIFESTYPQTHYQILHRSLGVLGKKLKRDMVHLRKPAATIAMDPKLLTECEEKVLPLGYACCYWVDHLADSLWNNLGSRAPSVAALPPVAHELLADNGTIHGFLKKHLLHWLEALSILGELKKVVPMIEKLRSLIDVKNQPELSTFLADAYRFVLTNFSIIEVAPLQVYSSALAFAPRTSVIKKQFESIDLHEWIRKAPDGEPKWSALLWGRENQDNFAFNTVSFSPDGKLLAASSADNCVVIWDAFTGAVLQTLSGHNASVNSIAFWPNSRQLVSVSDDRCIRTWDVSMWENPDTDIPASRTLSRDDDKDLGDAEWSEEHLLWSDILKLLTFKNIKSGLESLPYLRSGWLGGDPRSLPGVLKEEIRGLSKRDKQVLRKKVLLLAAQAIGSDVVRGVAISPDCRLMAVGVKQKVKLWGTEKGEPLQVLSGHKSQVFSVAFSQDSRWLASCSDDRTVRLWDTSEGGQLGVLKGHTAGVVDVSFSLGDTLHVHLLATASLDGTVKLWEVTSDNCKFRSTLNHGREEVRSVTFSSDGKRLASASTSGMIWVWDTFEGVLLRKFRGHSDTAKSVAFSPDGTRLASASSDGTVKLWDVASLWAADTDENCHRGDVMCLTWSPDKEKIASGGDDGTVKIWDVSSRKVRQTLDQRSVLTGLKDNEYSVKAVAFSPDGKSLASSAHKSVILWDLVSGKAIKTLIGHDDTIKRVLFSPDGETLVSAAKNATRFWYKSGEEMKLPHKGIGSLRSVAFSSDSRHIAGRRRPKYVDLSVWDVKSGRKLLEIDSLDDLMEIDKSVGLQAVAFSPNGQELVGAVQLYRQISWSEYERVPGCTFIFWDLNTGQESERLFSPIAHVPRMIRYSEDGGFLETEMGLVSIPWQRQAQALYGDSSPQTPHSGGGKHYEILVDENWVTYKNQKVLWLPSDYRVRCVAVHGSKLVLGHASGLVSFFDFDFVHLEDHRRVFSVHAS